MKKQIAFFLFLTACSHFAWSQTQKIPKNPKTMTPVQNQQQVRQTLASIIDPAITELSFSTIKRSSGDILRITVTLKNIGGANYQSNANQQNVQLFEEWTPDQPRQVKVFPFQNLNAGAGLQFVYETPAPKPGNEFPPNYRAVIVYEPDILSDANPKNDDANAANNSLVKNPRN